MDLPDLRTIPFCTGLNSPTNGHHGWPRKPARPALALRRANVSRDRRRDGGTTGRTSTMPPLLAVLRITSRDISDYTLCAKLVCCVPNLHILLHLLHELYSLWNTLDGNHLRHSTCSILLPRLKFVWPFSRHFRHFVLFLSRVSIY